MIKRKKPKQNSRSESDIRNSTVNLLLNILIFVFSVLIIYMIYSLIVKLTDPKPAIISEDKSPAASEIIQVEVLNGCGVEGVADRFTDFLRSHNFDVVKTDNYTNFDVEETLVIDRIGNPSNAKKTGEILGVDSKNILQQLNEDYFLDVSIIIGKDFFKLKPIK